MAWCSFPGAYPEIAQAVGLNEDEVLERCESMANKGIVFGRKKEGQMEYALLTTIPRIFELPFMLLTSLRWESG